MKVNFNSNIRASESPNSRFGGSIRNQGNDKVRKSMKNYLNSDVGARNTFKNLAGDSRNASPANKLFNRNKETLEDLLVRKLKLKYIDNNPSYFDDTWANS